MEYELPHAAHTSAVVALDHAVSEADMAELSCRQRELSSTAAAGGCRVLQLEMEVKAGPSQSSKDGERLASEAAAPGAGGQGEGPHLPFSKELIRFSLYGRVPAKLSKFKEYAIVIACTLDSV